MTDLTTDNGTQSPLNYAELHAHSARSFLDGVSQPEDLIAEAARQGLNAIALTDHDGLYGVVPFAKAARKHEISTIFGAELTLPVTKVHRGPLSTAPDPEGNHLVVLARDPQGYRNLSAAIATANLRTDGQGSPAYDLEELAAKAQGHWQILTGCRKGTTRRALEPRPGVFDIDAASEQVEILVNLFGKENVAVEITDHQEPLDAVRCDALAHVADLAGVRLVATGNVHYARPANAELAHVVASIRSGRELDELDGWLPVHGQAYIASPRQMYHRHRKHPHAVAAAAQIGAECAFDLTLVAPELPPFAVPVGYTEETWLRELVRRRAPQYYGPRERENERNSAAWEQLDHELQVICNLGFPGYFLIVYQIMEVCREKGILAQGRGSAANSAVCYVLGITAIDAVRHKLLFERFLSESREEAPDIDVDIESERREEVIQDVYSRYGRTHAAQVANVISYRPRSAIRDAARALGYEAGQQDAWSKQIERWHSFTTVAAAKETTDAQPESDKDDIPSDVIEIADQLLRLPRHLGTHPGGMVLCDRPVIEVCPVQWAAKEGRTVLQWDKEDCADAGLVKFDLLGLGMLTALRLMFTQIEYHEGEKVTLHGLPQDDEAVYDLLCRADTVGVFQVESRAQMATLPRLQPRTFYDIVVEVALIRPGPIQGGSVHPYINRRRAQQEGRLPPDEKLYAHPLLKPALERTLGVPLFQEQLMQIAVDVAGFTAAEADQLRRAIGSKRSHDRIEELEERLRQGMSQRGISEQIRTDIIAKLHAFADFGFPESHSFSFAYLVYASAWVKAHHPAAFYAGLLAAQPMGFYSPQSLTADARRHGVEVLRPCVQRSQALATVERQKDDYLAVRLGLGQVKGIPEAVAQRIVAVREQHGGFATFDDCVRHMDLSRTQLENLATAGAFSVWQTNRRHALWQAGPASLERQDTLPGITNGLTVPLLPDMDALEIAVSDVAVTGVSAESFPTQFLRADLAAANVLMITDLARTESGRRVAIAGVVTHRQRPATASGITFLSIEDESGLLNVICSPGFWARFRRVVRASPALVIRGQLERAEGVINLIAEHAKPLSLQISSRSRDFQ